MTQEEILDYNKRCALFLGWKETSEEFQIEWIGCKTKERLDKINKQYIPILEKDGNVLFPDFSVMDFTEDWNCIMKVVHEIVVQGFRKYSYDHEEHTRCVFTDMAIIYQKHDFGGGNIVADSGKCTTEKEAVVQAINQFLIWYKHNK